MGEPPRALSHNSTEYRAYYRSSEGRLNRTFGNRFGDELYSKEELVAEMGAAFLCAIAGIANEHTDRNTTAYIQNWIAKLEEDNRLIVCAAAQRAESRRPDSRQHV
jgi:antirestriction protein ArdC